LSFVTHPFASPLFRLSDLARWRVLRVLACVLALSLAASGFASAATPSHAAVAKPADAAGCAHHAQAQAAKPVHHADGCCGKACACAFAHALGLAAASSMAAHAPTRASIPLPLRESVHARGVPPPLRPPIA